MPTFCRHNRLLQNCPICSRELAEETQRLTGAPAAGAPVRAPRARARGGGGGGRPRSVRVRRAARVFDDGYRCALVPGIKLAADARRLARELARAAARIDALASDPPGLYGEAAAAADREEGLWLAFLVAYLSPLEDVPDPFEAIRAARVPFAAGGAPALDGAARGPRGAHDESRGQATIDGYRARAERAGSQGAWLDGDAAWTRERRFARAFERLALPGLHRAARYDLLVTLGALGLLDCRADTLALDAGGETALAAKRAFAIADALELDRRAAALAGACGVPLEALDLGLENWARTAEAGAAAIALGVDAPADPVTHLRTVAALGLEPAS